MVEACCAVVGHEFIARVGDGEGLDRSHEGEKGGGAEGAVRAYVTRTIASGSCHNEVMERKKDLTCFKDSSKSKLRTQSEKLWKSHRLPMYSSKHIAHCFRHDVKQTNTQGNKCCQDHTGLSQSGVTLMHMPYKSTTVLIIKDVTAVVSETEGPAFNRRYLFSKYTV
jgi:hypothetical protein